MSLRVQFVTQYHCVQFVTQCHHVFTLSHNLGVCSGCQAVSVCVDVVTQCHCMSNNVTVFRSSHNVTVYSRCHTMSPFVQVLSQKDDFLAIGLRNGHLKVVVSLGGWTQTDHVTKHSVTDGLWHSVTLQRQVSRTERE